MMGIVAVAAEALGSEMGSGGGADTVGVGIVVAREGVEIGVGT